MWEKISIVDLVFHSYREMYDISESEFDKVLNQASDSEIDELLIDDRSSLTQIKNALSIIQKYL